MFRRFRSTIAASLAVVFALGPAARAADSADPFLWLEDAHGPRALAWVAGQNARTRAVLAKTPVYAGFAADALRLVQAKDRIPNPSMIVAGTVYEFRQDAAHVRGIWRSTSLRDFAHASPTWRTVLDLDALAKADRANWVWEGADCDSPRETRCLVSLSDGGEDAVTIREFDLPSRRFVPGGFTFPHGKQSAAWMDADTILLSRAWAPGQLTTSGYPYVVKRVVRGRRLGDAVEVARGAVSDVSCDPETLQDDRGRRFALVSEATSFFETRQSLVTPQGLRSVAFPPKSQLDGYVDGRLLLHTREAWSTGGSTFRAGSLLAVDAAALAKDPAHPVASLVYAPGSREALESVTPVGGRILVTTLDNVRGRVDLYTPATGAGAWTKRRLALPDDAAIDVGAADDRGTTAILVVSTFLTPRTLWSVDVDRAALAILKRSPARFDASRDVVEQRTATSADGTHVPYFLVRPRAMRADGATPTILEAYGGFDISSTPSYGGLLGKLWLERGGAYALANIRGGGEFGPAWHEAGLTTHRQRVFDDFAAVARDLVKRRVTSPRRLGIEGASNGGLLMGVEMTQHPELFHAVDIGVPLLDMLRFERIAAGASWVGEYGSVSVPAQRDFLAKISPYANVRPDVRYPEPFVWTTTKDDRVGPQHARKFAARLAQLRDPYLFFEQTEGGHGAGANLKEDAAFYALEYAYFWKELVS